MLVSDVLLILALASFLGAIIFRSLPVRSGFLLLSALAALAAGSHGVLDDRWQAGIGAAVAAIFLLGLAVGRLRRRPMGVAGQVFATSATALLTALGIAAILLFPVSPLPVPGGPHAVGVRDFALTDTARRGVLGAAADEPRKLLVRVWYPASPAPGTQPRAYFSAAEAKATARGFGELIGFPPLLTHLKHVRTNAYENAPLLAGDGPRPVLFFSPGYIGYVASDSALMEELASHGYVIFSVQHSGDASPAVLPDGSVMPMDPGLREHMHHVFATGFPESMVRGYTARDFDERLDAQLRIPLEIRPPGDRGFAVSPPVWLADRLFVHDTLQSDVVPANVADIVAASDLTRTGEIGVSFGGSTSGAVCMVDPRCAAAVNLDGGDFHLTPFNADLPVPLLMFHADFAGVYRMFGVEPFEGMRSFNDFSYERFGNAGQRVDIYRMQLKGSFHAGLTDSALFLRRPLRDPLFGSAPVDILIGAPNDFVRGFFDRHLRGLNNDFPQAQYRRYAGWVEPYDNAPVRRWWLAKTPDERTAIEQRIAGIRSTLHSQSEGGAHDKPTGAP